MSSAGHKGPGQTMDRDWLHAAVEKLNADVQRSSDTHLISLPLPAFPEIQLYFMDESTHAERATDWRGNNNIAESIFIQMALEPNPVPRWIVCGAGTGGTSATLGRYVRYRCFDTRICVVDPVNSVFADYYRTRD